MSIDPAHLGVFKQKAHMLVHTIKSHVKLSKLSDFAVVMLEEKNLVNLFHTIHAKLNSYMYMNDLHPRYMDWDRLVPQVIQILITTDPVKPGSMYNPTNFLWGVQDAIRHVLLNLESFFEHSHVEYTHGLDMAHWVMHGKQYRPGPRLAPYNRLKRPEEPIPDMMEAYKWQDENNRLSERRSIGTGVNQNMYHKMYSTLDKITKKVSPYTF